MRLLLLLSLCIFCGCSKPIDTILFNNSGGDIIVEVTGDDKYAGDGKYRKKIDVPYGSQAVLKSWVGYTYYIRGENWSGVYEPIGDGLEFVGHYGWGPFFSRKLKVQLENDKHIFAVAFDDELPVISFVDQPSGFPIKPKKTEKLGHTL